MANLEIDLYNNEVVTIIMQKSILKIIALFSMLVASSFSHAHSEHQSLLNYPHHSNIYNDSGSAIVHMFNYPFSKIEDELPVLAQTGFKYIQISPPQLSRGDIEWYGRYQPLDYRVIDGPLGNEWQLQSLINSAAKLGMGIIVDVVLNHTAELGDDYDLTYPPLWAQEKYNVSELFNASHFHPAFCIKDYNNPEEVRKGRMCKPEKNTGGLPDLDLSQDYVLQTHVEYINKLKRMGAAGFRFDAAKHMEVSYFQRLLNRTNDGQTLMFAEIIADRTHYDRDLGPFLRNTSLKFMDFPLQKTIVDAFAWGGDIRWLLGDERTRSALPRDKSISFVVNHDIPNNFQFSYLILDPIDEQLANIFMFARKGSIPHVYTDLGVRDRLKYNRWHLYHRKPVVRAGVLFHNLTQNSDERIIFANECALVIKRGIEGIATLNKCSKAQTFTLHGPNSYNYMDLLTGQMINRSQNSIEVKIPGRTGQLYIRQ